MDTERAMTGPAEPSRAWRQAMDSGELLLVAAAGMLVAAAVAQTAAVGVVQPRTALAFGALVALGELLRLALPGGRESAPIGSAGALAYALLLGVGGQPLTAPATQPALQVVAVGSRAGAPLPGADGQHGDDDDQDHPDDSARAIAPAATVGQLGNAPTSSRMRMISRIVLTRSSHVPNVGRECPPSAQVSRA